MSRFLFAFFLVVFFAFSAPAFAEPDPEQTPDFLHLSWQNAPSTTMTIMWRTSADITASVAEYGLTASHGDSVIGTSETAPEGRGNLHTAEITGLTPKTTYHYRVGDGDGHWSPDRTFKTVSDPSDLCTPMRFIAMGDSRSTFDHGASLYWSTVMDAATDEEPEFILFNGDAIADGDEQRDGWESWFDFAHNDIRTQPIMAGWGNHEDRGDSFFLDNFALPVNDVTFTEDFYDFQVGPIHFFSMDTERIVNRYPVQATWLDEKLAGTDSIWTISYHHRPTYSSGTTHGSEADCQNYWAPVFDDYHMDVDIGSHDHIYERTKPVFDGLPIPNEDYSQGTMYLVTGGAGAFVNPILNIWNNFYLKGIGAFHYVLFEVEFNKLWITAKSPLGVVYDSVSLEKPELGYPTADFLVDLVEIRAGDAVRFDGTGSVDPCGEIIDFAWEFGDGDTGSGGVITHAYSAPGLVTAKLTVTDLDGYTAETTMQLNILPGGADDDIDDDADDDSDDDWHDDDSADDDAADDDAADDDGSGGGDDDDAGGCGC